MLVIDAHLHVWDPRRAPYPWFGPEHAAISGPRSVDDIAPTLDDLAVDRVVLVQAADNDADTDNMFATAEASARVAGVVAWLPLDRPDAAATRLGELRRRPAFAGIRSLIHDQPDPDWLGRPEVDEGLSVLEDAGVPFDVVAVLPRHLEHACAIAERHPRLRLVIDHLGHPPIQLPERSPWWELIAAAGSYPNVWAKVSGLYPATGTLSADWTVDDLRPFVERAVEVFGPARLMYGGDWPVSVLSGGYRLVWAGLAAVLADLPEVDRARVYGGSAAEFYGLASDRRPASPGGTP